MKLNRLLAGFFAATALFAIGCGKTVTPVSAPEPTARPDMSTLLTQVEAEDYTEGYSGDNWNQTGYYAETNDGPIDITISYNDGNTILYRAIFTNGDWANYTIDVEKSGAHLFVVNGIGAGEFYLDNIDNPIPFECEDDEKGFVANIMLDAGKHTVKVLAPTYLDMDSLSLYAGDSNHYMTAEDVAAYVAPAPAEIDKDAVQLELYVSPKGKDNNSGKKRAPFKTLARAQEEVRKYNANMTGNIIVHFAPGYYQLDEVQVFSEADSGSNGYSIIYKGDSEKEPTLFSGGTKVEGWKATELLDGKIWKASTDIEDTRTLYINGYPAQRARGSYQYMYTENLEPADAKYQDNFNLAVQPADVKSSGIKVPMQDIFLQLEHPEDVELVWHLSFTHQRTPVRDIYVDPENSELVVFEMDMPYWEWANTKEAYFSNPVYWDNYPDVVNYESTFYLENALALLDEPGEFYFDKTTKEIYYYPYEEEDLKKADIYAGTTEFMIQVMGSGATSRVENITFENLEFRYGAWTAPNTTGVQILQTDHIVSHRRTNVANGGMALPGQITLNFTRNVNIYDCVFRALGSSAVVMDNGVADSEVVGNVFMDISGTGIMVDSYEHRGIMPEGRVRCDNVLIADNVLHRTANEYYGMTGISMYLPSNTIVRNNDINDVPYSGIVAGWGWHSAAAVASANCKIVDNKIEDVMKVLGDGGHIYTLDRVHNLEISGNYCVTATDWRGGIYLDAGSRAYDIHHNVVADTYHWFFGGPGLKIQDIELYDNYYDAESLAQIDNENIKQSNNIAVERGADGKPQWPKEALDIIEKAGLEEGYKHLLEGTELPEWRTNIIMTMPKELIRAEVGGSDVAGAITIQAESYTKQANTVAYVKNTGEAVRYSGGDNCYTMWDMVVEDSEVYTFKAIGTGTVLKEQGYSAIVGRLYVNDELMYVINMNTNEKYNPWDNALESVFGAVKLEPGIHTIKLEIDGGVYVLDRIDAIPAAITIEAEAYSQTAGTEALIDGDNEAVKYKKEAIGYAIYTLGVANDGSYSFSAIGNGKGNGATGRVFIDGTLALESKLNTSEKLNPWESPLETSLGSVDLKAGTYTIRFEVEGGDYALDKILVSPPALDGGEGGTGSAGGEATNDAAIAVTVEAEDYNEIQNAEDYIKEGYPGAAVKYNATEGVTTPVYTTWTMNVAESDTYTFKTIGTGMILTNEGYTAVTGKLYINDELKLTMDMTTNERYNPWDNPLETVFGTLKLNAGTYTVKLEMKGGTYVLDKFLLLKGESTQTGSGKDTNKPEEKPAPVNPPTTGGTTGTVITPVVNTGFEISATEVTSIEAEDYSSSDGIQAYEKNAGKAVKFLGNPSYTTYEINVTSAGVYSFTTVGTGMQSTLGVPIMGNLYIDSEPIFSVDLVTNEKYNPWENPLESLIGSVELTEGTHKIKFENVRGEYIMDKMIIAPGTAN